MKILYKIKAVIGLLCSLYFLFFTEEWKTFVAFFIYSLLMWVIYFEEFLTEIKELKNDKKY